jgi:amino acid efflux transporter
MEPSPCRGNDDETMTAAPRAGQHPACSPAPAASRALAATIGLPQAVALYLGAVLGAGVLILPGAAASEAGPASLLAWGFVGVLGIPIALTFASLASAFPDAGGVATYAARGFSPAAGTVVGWFYFTAGSVGQAIVPLAGGHYVSDAAGWGRGGAFAVAGIILLAALVANLGGLRVSARVQLAVSAAVAVLLLAAIAAAVPHADLDRFSPLFPHGLAAAGQAAVPLFFAFAGWEAITHLSAEFHRAERDLILATLLTAGLVLFLYLGIAAAVVATATYGDPELDRVAVTHLLGNSLGVSARVAGAVAAAAIALGTTNAFVAGTSRLGYALGRDGGFPDPIGRLTRSRVPRNGILAVGAVAAGALGLTLLAGWGAEKVVVVPASLVIATYLVGMAAGVRLLHGGGRVLAGLAFVSCALIAPFVGASVLIPLTVMVGALLYRRRRDRAQTAS